jgi:hypothetical protein
MRGEEHQSDPQNPSLDEQDQKGSEVGMRGEKSECRFLPEDDRTPVQTCADGPYLSGVTFGLRLR